MNLAWPREKRVAYGFIEIVLVVSRCAPKPYLHFWKKMKKMKTLENISEFGNPTWHYDFDRECIFPRSPMRAFVFIYIDELCYHKLRFFQRNHVLFISVHAILHLLSYTYYLVFLFLPILFLFPTYSSHSFFSIMIWCSCYFIMSLDPKRAYDESFVPSFLRLCPVLTHFCPHSAGFSVCLNPAPFLYSV